MLNKETISALFREKTSRPLPYKEIVHLMGLSRPEARALKRLLREMLRTGELIINRKGMYGPAEEMNLLSGYFEAHRDGYGLILPEKPGERDFFIPPQKTAGAMRGDRVMARVESWKKREARVIRGLERASARIVGKIEITRSGSFIKPKERSVPFDLYVAPDDRKNAKNGDLVIAEITVYPTDKRQPAAHVVKVVERPQSPADDVELIIDEFGLPRRFPKQVSDAAKLLAASPPEGPRHERRKDLRQLVTVTIDGERAKDFDDAVSIERNGRGFRLWVHIADVSHFVPWYSPLDSEARSRGTSVYFPNRVIPMLPKELSEDLCSLKPNVDRLAFTVEMDFDGEGEQIASQVYPSLIRSDERMTYTSVRKILIDRDAAERRKYEHLLGGFETMGELCSILKERRLRRGSLDLRRLPQRLLRLLPV
jgi:ribonuclease R